MKTKIKILILAVVLPLSASAVNVRAPNWTNYAGGPTSDGTPAEHALIRWGKFEMAKAFWSTWIWTHFFL